jgi:hypothetical protein
MCGLQIRSVVVLSTNDYADQIQTITNACATVALLNIVMNIPEINLGDALSTFKAETRRLKPPYRGKKLGCDAFIRNIHNSFARYELATVLRYSDANWVL